MVRDMNMNKLELIISGNLTGFSRFFVTSEANDLLKDAKIDFDYRNFVSFMEEGDKTYAVSFAPQVIALSLVSRTLDSFRRPGILVVSLLLPRNTKVESINNPQNEQSIYQLLNAVNDKFNEKNLHNGMLNQNPIVLMQDYYSEILANYRLVQDNQRGVNVSIDNSAFNKNVGYVKSAEKDIVSYLNTPCRRNYEGYQSIFISPKAPQNINEPVEELKLYSVYVNNTNQRLSNVTIDSVIQTVFPERGEIDVPDNVKNITYRQALDGQGVPYIKANMNGDTIHLAYRFEKEKKQVTFKIMKGSDEVDFSLVTLVIQNDDDTYYTISSNPYIFMGKEIYKAKTLKSGDDNYIFSQPLDLSRIPDGGTIPVKILPAVSHPSNTRAVNSKPTPLVPPVGGHEKTLVTNAYRNVKNESPIRNGGVLSFFKSNNDKGKSKSKHEIRKVVIPLVALWLVLGGIYAAWTYFSKNTETKTMNVETDELIDKTISFYIADTSGSQGEVSDSLKKDLYGKLDKNHHITFELSATINDTPAKVELLNNDIVHYAVKVNGVPDDSLNVNLIVKWTGEGRQESILVIPKTYSLSELKEGKVAIQLPVAFSELKIYNEVKLLDRKNSKMLARIMAVERKSEELYNALMAAYDKTPDEVPDEKVDQHEINKDIKEEDTKALEKIRAGEPVSLDNYKWKKGHRTIAKKWNDAIYKCKIMPWVKQNVKDKDWSTLSAFIIDINNKKS